VITKKVFENEFYLYGNVEDDIESIILDLLNNRGYDLEKKGRTTYFKFIYKSNEYLCGYSQSNLKSKFKVNRITVSLRYDSRKERAAFAFNSLIERLKTKNNLPIGVHITPIKDELSVYFSGRVYKRIAEYEWSLRSLISTIFIPLFDSNWTNKLTKNIDQSDFKFKAKKFEVALLDLDLSQIETIFFGERDVLNSERYDEEILGKVNRLDKDELIELLKEKKPQSLWEMYFSDKVNVNDSKKRLKKIRNLRNKIAHNKTFNGNDFNTLKNELNYIIPKINKLEDDLRDQIEPKSIKLSLQMLEELIQTDYLKQISSIAERLKKAFSNPAIEQMSIVAGNLANIYTNPVIEQLNNLTSMIQSMNYDIGRQFINVQDQFHSDLIIKQMETNEEIKGRGFVHWKASQEAYSEIIPSLYLSSRKLNDYIRIAKDDSAKTLIAKINERVIGFVAFDECRDEVINSQGEIMAIYILEEYYSQQIGCELLKQALDKMNLYSEVYVWVLENNHRAINFFEKFGFSIEDISRNIIIDDVELKEVRMKVTKHNNI